MMIEVGTLEKQVAASAKRAIEDELDWEHLPHTHRTTFSAVSLIEADRNGWEANVTLVDGTAMRMKVTIDDDRMGYTNATYFGDVENGRAVCRLEDIGDECCKMSLRFLVPETPDMDKAAIGAFYCDLFSRLIDEDEPKMIYATKAQKEGADAHKKRRIATLADGSEIEVPVVCPHRGLPLDCEPDENGTMTCPWHGYQFDAVTGECLSGQIKGWKGQ